MPVYDYKCEEHGLFFELATLAQSGAPCACPKCGQSSPRVVLIPPEVLDMAPAKRQAQAANEQARHEPIVSSVSSREEAQARAEYAAQKSGGQRSQGCGCGSHHRHDQHRHESAFVNNSSGQSALKQQVVLLPDGSTVFPSQRPWMISH